MTKNNWGGSMRSERIKIVSAFASALAVSTILAACGGGGGGDSGSGSRGTSTNAAGTGASLGSGGTNGTTSANTNTSTSTSTAAPVAITPVADGKLHAACTNCGVSDDQTYNGIGVGLWQASNTSTQNAVVNVSLQNVGNRNFTYVFTNDGTDQTMPSVTLSTDVTGFVSKSMVTAAPKTTESPQMQAIREFNNHGWTGLTTRGTDTANGAVANSVAKAVQRDTVMNVVGSTQRAFWLADDTQR